MYRRPWNRRRRATPSQSTWQRAGHQTRRPAKRPRARGAREATRRPPAEAAIGDVAAWGPLNLHDTPWSPIGEAAPEIAPAPMPPDSQPGEGIAPPVAAEAAPKRLTPAATSTRRPPPPSRAADARRQPTVRATMTSDVAAPKSDSSS